jgi:GLPGLI family protein
MKMVRLIVISCCLLVASHFTYAQLEVEYSINYNGFNKSNTETSQGDLSFKKNVIEPSLNIINSSTGVLNICNNQSYFSIVSRPNDDINKHPFANSIINGGTWLTSEVEAGNVDTRNRRIIVADYTGESWSIQREPKIITGYTCYKATKELKSKEFPQINRQLEVWFTPEIPVNSGFMDAIGLPGLILYYNDKILELTAVKVSTLKKCDINVPQLDRISFTAFNKEAAARMEERRNRKK